MFGREASDCLGVDGSEMLPSGEENLFLDSEVQRSVRPELEEPRRRLAYVSSAAQIQSYGQRFVVVSGKAAKSLRTLHGFTPMEGPRLEPCRRKRLPLIP